MIGGQRGPVHRSQESGGREFPAKQRSIVFSGLALLLVGLSAKMASAADAERLAMPSVDAIRGYCHEIIDKSNRPEARARASRYLELTAVRDWKYTAGGGPRSYRGAFAEETRQDGRSFVRFTSRAYVPLENLDAADRAVVEEIRQLSAALREDYAAVAGAGGRNVRLPSADVNEFSAENNRRAEEARRLQNSRGVLMPVPNPLGVAEPAASQTTLFGRSGPWGAGVPPPPVALPAPAAGGGLVPPPPPVPHPPPAAGGALRPPPPPVPVSPAAAGGAAPLPAPPGGATISPPPPGVPATMPPAAISPGTGVPIATRTVESGNPLPPVTVFFVNNDKQELVLRIAGPRDPNQRIELHIPAHGSAKEVLERFVGAQISQSTVVAVPGGGVVQQNRQFLARSQARYTVAVYENRVQYRYNAAPNSPPGALPSFDTRGMVSLGVFTIPADERLGDGDHFDVYRLARMANNPGAAVWSGLPE